MSSERAFPIDSPGAPVTLADLSYVPAPLDKSGRPVGGLSSRPTVLQLLMGSILLLIGGLLLLVLYTARPGLTATQPGEFLWLVAIAVAVCAGGLGMIWSATRRRKAAPPQPGKTGLVVPATVIHSRPVLFADSAKVRLTFDLYANRHEVTVFVKRRLARDLKPGDQTSLIVVPGGFQLICFYDPPAAASAVKAALEAVQSAPLPVARIADAPAAEPASPPPPQRFTFRFDLTPEENAEAYAIVARPAHATQARGGIPHSGGGAGCGLAGWLLFIILATTLFVVLNRRTDTPTVTPGQRIDLTPLQPQPRWPLPTGVAIIVAGAAAWVFGLRALLRNARKITRGEIECEVSEDALRVSGPHFTATYGWPMYTQFHETPHLFVLADRRFYRAIPKRAVGGEDRQLEFRQFLRRKLPPPSQAPA